MLLRGDAAREPQQRLAIVPRHPLRGLRGQFRFVPLQFDQIVEWIDTIQFTGVDEAHEQIAHLRAFQRLVEQRVLAIQNRLLQRTLHQVMPTPGLCRVEMVFARFLYISTLAVAA